jgi:uncharacterized protein (DUF427 family)
MKAIWKDTVIAESDDTVVVEGNHYFPQTRSSASTCLQQPQDHLCSGRARPATTRCSSMATLNPDAVWYYPEPKPEAEMVRGRVAFWKGVKVA